MKKQEKDDIGEFIRNLQQEGFIDTLSKESKGKLLKAIDDIFWTDKIGRTRVNNAARYWEFAKECPPPAVRRDEKFWIASSPADPVWDIDSLPMTYMDSRWSAFIIHIEEDSLQNILPPPLKPWDGERNNVAELWYVDHAKSAFGPHCKSGVAISAFYKDKRGNVWLGAYYPVMYINSDAPLGALSTIGCAVKQATIRCTCHEGPNRVTYSDKGNDYFSFGTCRNGYLIHTASGKFDDTPIMPPYFYGRSDWGKFSVKTVIAGVHDDQISYARNLWYLPSTIPPTPTFGIKGHRFMIKSEYTRTSRAASFKWFFQATPFDRLGNILRIKEVEGLISFVMDLYIPYANLLGTVSL